MNQPLYIRAATAISPQHTFGSGAMLHPVVSSEDGKLFVIEQEYIKYISPVAIRRMSKLLKMSLSTGMQCLIDAGITQPDAIITGTGRGSVTDMEHFLTDMIHMKEEALNPTYFIQSTYNSVNGWLALQTKCTCYNQTYVHRGFSLELAIQDAQLLAAESSGTPQTYLVGCFDELTPYYYLVKSKIAYWKKEQFNSLQLLVHNDTPGSIAGEGAAFFALSTQRENAVCAIQSLSMLQSPSAWEIRQEANKILQQNALTPEDIDVVLCGTNGDVRYQPIYDTVLQCFSDTTMAAAFKHLCGEYDTVMGFAIWLANYIYTSGNIPASVVIREGKSRAIKNMIICNHWHGGNVSMILVKSCE